MKKHLPLSLLAVAVALVVVNPAMAATGTDLQQAYTDLIAILNGPVGKMMMLASLAVGAGGAAVTQNFLFLPGGIILGASINYAEDIVDSVMTAIPAVGSIDPAAVEAIARLLN